MTWSLRWGKAGPAVSRRAMCAACGRAFSCEVSIAGCWCQEVSISREARARIRARFSDCLCRECLTREALSVPPDVERPEEGLPKP